MPGGPEIALDLGGRVTVPTVGENFEIIADVDATESEAPALASEVLRWLVGEGIVSGQLSDCE